MAAIILGGAILRFSTLALQSFWEDEGYTFEIVQHGLGHVLSEVPRTESTPPLYYVLVWVWSRAFGLHEAGLRSFSALCGTLTIVVVWALGRRLVSRRVGLIAALLTAVNPLLVWYSQEARAYALLVLLCALSLLLLIRASERPTTGRSAAWGGVCALALCTHYFAAFVILPEAVWLLLGLRAAGPHRRRTMAAALAPVAAMAVALAPLLVTQSQNGRTGWIAASGSLPYRLSLLAKEDVVAYGTGAVELAGLCGLALAGIAIWLLRRSTRREHERLLMPLVVLLAGLVMTVALALSGHDYLNTRNLLPTWPAVVLLVAAGAGGARAGRAGPVIVAVLAAIGLFGVIDTDLDPQLQRADWRGARARACARVPGDRLRLARAGEPAALRLPPPDLPLIG